MIHPYQPDKATLLIMRRQEQRWALESGDETAAYSDWRQHESLIIHSEVRNDGTRYTYFDNGGFMAVGPTKRVGGVS